VSVSSSDDSQDHSATTVSTSSTLESTSSLDSTLSQDPALPIHSPNVLAALPPSVTAVPVDNDAPLIYWGYLVKNRFMAGELYALSFALVDWVGKDPVVKTLIKGAEDKQTSKWMRKHPRASEIRWASERCWIYDHPRGGTVYSHGILFPSEAKRVQRDVKFDLEHRAATQQVLSSDAPSGSLAVTPFGPYGTPPASWSRSTVSTFGVRYSLPMPDMAIDHSVEALVEGTEMSRLRDGTPGAADYAWRHREGRNKRYDGKRVGGTVVVHFIKKNMWFLETAKALLGGDDITDLELEEAEFVKDSVFSALKLIPRSFGKPHITSSVVPKRHVPQSL